MIRTSMPFQPDVVRLLFFLFVSGIANHKVPSNQTVIGISEKATDVLFHESH